MISCLAMLVCCASEFDSLMMYVLYYCCFISIIIIVISIIIINKNTLIFGCFTLHQVVPVVLVVLDGLVMLVALPVAESM